jgi:hypothetical protein
MQKALRKSFCYIDGNRFDFKQSSALLSSLVQSGKTGHAAPLETLTGAS